VKRSKSIKLALIAPGGLLLTACQPSSSQQDPNALAEISMENAMAYRSVDDCVRGGIYTEAACASAFEGAREALPRFDSFEACEETHGEGNCEVYEESPERQGSGIGSWIGPALMGYMVGNMMSRNNSGQVSSNLYREPIYRSRNNNGNWNTAAAAATQRAQQQTQSLNRQLQTQRAAQTQSRQASSQRSGFGTRSAGRGSFGG